MLEIEAGKFLANCFKEAFIKTVKFKENPNPDELNKQLILVKNQFNAIHSSIKNLTVRVEKRKANKWLISNIFSLLSFQYNEMYQVENLTLIIIINMYIFISKGRKIIPKIFF